jgi:hypothetical protein
MAFAFSGITAPGEWTNGLGRAPFVSNGAIGASMVSGATAGAVIANGTSAWNASAHKKDVISALIATGESGSDASASDRSCAARQDSVRQRIAEGSPSYFPAQKPL